LKQVLISDEKTFTANPIADFTPDSAEVLDLEDQPGPGRIAAVRS
jgi:hypothetical protein